MPKARKPSPGTVERGIYVRPDADGYWVRLMVRGERVRRFGGQTLTEARHTLAKLRADTRDAQRLPDWAVTARGLPLGQFSETWLKAPAKDEASARAGSLAELWFRSRRTKKDIRSDISRWALVEEFFQDGATIRDLDAARVERFRDWLVEPRPHVVQAEGRGGRKRSQLSPATANRVLGLLRAALRLAKQRGHAHPDPFDQVRLLAEPRNSRRPWTREEFRLFVQEAEDDRLRILIRLAYSTGLRMGALLALRWDQIDLKSKFAFIPPKNQKRGQGLTVPLTADAVKALKAWEEDHGGRLFDPAVTTAHMSPKFSALKKRLGFGDEVTFHSARHSVRGRLADAGVALEDAKAILGHNTTEASLRYAATNSKRLRAVMEKANRGAF